MRTIWVSNQKSPTLMVLAKIVWVFFTWKKKIGHITCVTEIMNGTITGLKKSKPRHRTVGPENTRRSRVWAKKTSKRPA